MSNLNLGGCQTVASIIFPCQVLYMCTALIHVHMTFYLYMYICIMCGHHKFNDSKDYVMITSSVWFPCYVYRTVFSSDFVPQSAI